MRIADLFASRELVISFEIFPPKPDSPIETIYTTLDGLHQLKPDFISVTYGAGGSTSARTLEIASAVKNKYGIETLAHLTCVGATRETIDQTLDTLHSHNIENILALRGDPPAGQTNFTAELDGYQYACNLIEHIKATGRFCIAAAAYPEGHPECADIKLSAMHLKHKVAAGADFLVTQLFFDNQFYYAFLEQLAAIGVHCPISIGIMPVTNANQIKRITSLCGAAIPASLQQIMDKYGTDPIEMEKAGLDYACRQIDDLISSGVKGIHLYTMNKAHYAKTIVQDLKLR